MKTEDIDFIVIHCTATRPDVQCGFAEVDAMHKARGWNGFGYHGIVRRDGTFEIGRPLNAMGAHVRGFNARSWGIAYEGGLNASGKPEDTRTEAQNTTLKSVVKGLLLRARYAEVIGHRDLSPDKNNDGIIDKSEWVKECPCFDVRKWWKETLSK